MSYGKGAEHIQDARFWGCASVWDLALGTVDQGWPGPVTLQLGNQLAVVQSGFSLLYHLMPETPFKTLRRGVEET